MGTLVDVLEVKLTEPRLDIEGIRGDGSASLVVGATTILQLKQCFVLSDELVLRYMANELALVTDQRDKLKVALQLAKDMFIANNIILPHTFEVIDEALYSNKA